MAKTRISKLTPQRSLDQSTNVRSQYRKHQSSCPDYKHHSRASITHTDRIKEALYIIYDCGRTRLTNGSKMNEPIILKVYFHRNLWYAQSTMMQIIPAKRREWYPVVMDGPHCARALAAGSASIRWQICTTMYRIKPKPFQVGQCEDLGDGKSWMRTVGERNRPARRIRKAVTNVVVALVSLLP